MDDTSIVTVIIVQKLSSVSFEKKQGQRQARAMEGKLSKVSQSLTPSPIQELSHLAQRCGAINLAEGFPDFPAPDHVKHAAISAINSNHNQYRYNKNLEIPIYLPILTLICSNNSIQGTCKASLSCWQRGRCWPMAWIQTLLQIMSFAAASPRHLLRQCLQVFVQSPVLFCDQIFSCIWLVEYLQ